MFYKIKCIFKIEQDITLTYELLSLAQRQDETQSFWHINNGIITIGLDYYNKTSVFECQLQANTLTAFIRDFYLAHDQLDQVNKESKCCNKTALV